MVADKCSLYIFSISKLLFLKKISPVANITYNEPSLTLQDVMCRFSYSVYLFSQEALFISLSIPYFFKLLLDLIPFQT